MLSATLPRSPQQAARPSPTQRRVRRIARGRVPDPEVLDIVHITAECWPFARTGGLGEAVAGLAASQSKAGSKVTLIMPLYRMIRESSVKLQPAGSAITVNTASGPETVHIYEIPPQPGRPRVIFIAHESFDRAGIYGEGGRDYGDNGWRFALLSAAAIEALAQVAPAARVVHAHDWHAAPALAYVRNRRTGSRHAPLGVLSVHNAAFQGQFEPECIAAPGFSDSRSAFAWCGRTNYLKGGLSCSDLAFTVSPNHAAELCTPEGAFGLHEHFSALGDRLIGVLNGIDLDIWDPATDPLIAAAYSRSQLAGKADCKALLQRECGLRESRSTPLFAMCTRLTEQKGLDLILGSHILSRSDAQFLFVGRGEHRYEEALASLAGSAPDRVALRLDFSDALEHRMIAGADALIMPSLFEPCGLTQMRAQRYGTIPVVRRVGGLADTVTDTVTGFVFHEYTAEAFTSAIRLAADCFGQRRLWRGMMKRAMLRDFGWERAAGIYGERYRLALAAAPRER